MIRSRYRALNTIMSLASGFTGILDKFSGAVAAYSTRKLKTSYPTTLPADYGGGAAAAYSLRKVKSDYEGSAVKVRRSSDGGLQDIGFDSNGNLDTTALLAFVNEDVEKIVNGDFATDTDWTKGTGWTISGGTANCDGTQTSSSEFKTAVGIAIQGVEVTFSFEVKNYSAGTLNATIEGTGALEFSGINANGLYSTTATSSDALPRVTFTASSDFVGSIDDVSVIQTTADGHVTRWYSQSDPVDTYTADFSGGVDNFVANGDNTLTGGLSITDEYGTTIDNVLELSCKNTNDTQHPMRKNNPFGGSNPINGKTLKCSFKMLVPLGQTGLVSAALSDGNLTTNGILSDGKVTEQGRWTTFTDVAWTQTALQSRLIFMGLDSNNDPKFVADAGDKFYIADVVLTETRDAYNGEGSQQPLIVEGGDVVLENGKAAIDFDGVDDNLQNPSLITNTTHTIVAAFVDLDTRPWRYFYDGGGSVAQMMFGMASTEDQYRYSAGGTGTFSTLSGTFADPIDILSFAVHGTTSQIAINGALNLSGESKANPNAGKFNIGESAANSLNAAVKFWEIIVFASDQSTNRKDIEWNINNHYSIYEQWDRKSCMNVRRSSDNATQDIGFSGKNINQTQLESFVNDASPVLDDYTGDDVAVSAYSLRKVRSAYDGFAIKVRRSSDNELKDIGFDANGDLDTTALTDFVGGQNLLVQSNQFDTTWTLGSGLSLTSGQSGYDGSSDAWEYSDTSTGNSLGQTCSTSGVQTLSIYAKSGTADGIRLRWLGGSGGNAYFNVTDASTEAYQSTNTIATKKEDVGSGWFRVSLTFNDSVNTIRLYVADGSSTSSTSGSIYIQDAQLEEGSTATTYNPTTTGIGGDGAVTTWYDQTQNDPVNQKNATQTAGSDQPLVVSAGALVTEGDRPAMSLVDGQYFDNAGVFGHSRFDFFSVSKITDTTGMFLSNATSGGKYSWVYGRNSVNTTIHSSFGTPTMYSNSVLQSLSNRGDVYNAYNGHNIITTLGGDTSSWTDGFFFGYNGFEVTGTVQEIICFDSDQSTTRLSIEGNIGRYYNLTGYRDGFVTKWYDQSGEYNHAENSASDEQPQIVSNGSMLKENGKAAISGNTKNLNVSSATLQNTFDIFSICNIDTECYIADMRSGDVNGNMILGRRSTGWLYNGSSWLGNGSSVSTSTQILANFEISTTSATYHENGLSVETISHSVNTSTNEGFKIAFLSGQTLKVQELIFFNSDQSGNRTDIEKNINTHFKIYS